MSASQEAVEFTTIGPCVRAAQPYQAVVTRDSAAGKEVLFLTCGVTDGGSFFLLAIDPHTGHTQQYQPADEPPVGHGYVGGTPDGDLVVTTTDGRIYHFDAGTREFERLAEGLSWIWEPELAPDGWLYAATYKLGGPGVIRVHPGERTVEDLGVMGPPDDDNAYTGRRLAFDRAGIVYCPVGLRVHRLVAYDPRTRTQKLLTPAGEAWDAAVSVVSGGDGKVYVRSDTRLFVAEAGTLEEVPPATAIPPRPLRLADGTAVTIAGDRTLILADPADVSERWVSFEYEAAAGLRIVEAMDGELYGFSNYPNRAFSYDPATGAIREYGNVPGGSVFCMLPHQGKFWIAGYAMPMAVWDPSRPWIWGTEPTSNPRSVGTLVTQASAAVFSPARHRIYLGWAAGYGPAGGHIVELDPETGEWSSFQPYAHQGIVSLTLHAPTGLLVGGTHRGRAAPGCIPSPGEEHCFLFLWDPVAREKIAEIVPFAEAENIPALAATPAGQVVGVCGDRLFFFDVSGRRLSLGPELPTGVRCLRLGPRGMLYAVCDTGEFLRIDPDTRVVETVAACSRGRPLAIAPLGDSLYFLLGAELAVLRL